MVDFDDFPEEILVDVVARIHRNTDLASFSCVSKRIHELVAPSLKYTRLDYRIKDSYRYLNDDSYDALDARNRYRSFLCSTLVSILARREPILALSAKSVVLDWPVRDTYRKEDCFVVANNETSHALELLFQRTGIFEWQGGQALVQALKEGKHDAYVAVILWLLSDLKDLNINMAACDDIWLPWAIRKATSIDFVPSALSSGFRSLRAIDISLVPVFGERNGIALDSIAAFFLLPSIDRIFINSKGAPVVNHEGDFDWAGTCFRSTLTTLSVFSCSIALMDLEKLLSLPESLKFFNFVVDGQDHDYVEFDLDRLAALVIEKEVQRSEIHIGQESRIIHGSEGYFS